MGPRLKRASRRASSLQPLAVNPVGYAVPIDAVEHHRQHSQAGYPVRSDREVDLGPREPLPGLRRTAPKGSPNHGFRTSPHTLGRRRTPAQTSRTARNRGHAFQWSWRCDTRQMTNHSRDKPSFDVLSLQSLAAAPATDWALVCMYGAVFFGAILELALH